MRIVAVAARGMAWQLTVDITTRAVVANTMWRRRLPLYSVLCLSYLTSPILPPNALPAVYSTPYRWPRSLTALVHQTVSCESCVCMCVCARSTLHVTFAFPSHATEGWQTLIVICHQWHRPAIPTMPVCISSHPYSVRSLHLIAHSHQISKYRTWNATVTSDLLQNI